MKPAKQEVYQIVNGKADECNNIAGERYYVRKDGDVIKQIYFIPSAESRLYGVQSKLIRPKFLPDGRRDFSVYFKNFPGLERVIEYTNGRTTDGGSEHQETDESSHKAIIVDFCPTTPERPLRVVVAKD